MKRVKRKKAWVGAVIGLAGSIIGSILNHNAQKKQLKEQEANQYESRNLTTAANLANAINGSQDAANTYYDRMTLMKMGGNRYKRKCEAGSEIKTTIPKNSFDIGELFSGIGTATSSVMSGVNAINAANTVQNVRQAPAQFQPKQLVMPSYYNRIQPSQYVFKNGGRKIARGGTRKRGKNEYNGEIAKNKTFYYDLMRKKLYPYEFSDNVLPLYENITTGVPLEPEKRHYEYLKNLKSFKSNNKGLTDEYTTELTNEEEDAFQNWYKAYSRLAGLDSNPEHPAHQYDYRGYWLNELKGGNENTPIFEHLPDTYKRPGHPTFSRESIYSTSETPGGRWDGDTFIPSWFNRVVSGDLDGNKAVFKNGELVGRLLPEIVVEAPRKRKGNKYKRK